MSEACPIRVAIVDDDPSYGRAVARLLRASRMETRTFASAEEYLASGAEGSVDCLLLDVQLGGMSGFDLRCQLDSAGSRTAVVFISGLSEESTAVRAAEAGCAFVRKSDPGEVVLEAIRQAVVGPALYQPPEPGVRLEDMTTPPGERTDGRARLSVENDETIAKRDEGGPPIPRREPSPAAEGPVSRYEIRDRLGSGGMGIVSTAFDRQLRREVAVKVLRPELFGEAVTREQFTEEAVVLAGLDHPGAVPVYETGTLEDGSPFCAMKKVRGVTLRDVLFERNADSLASREDLAHLVDVFERVCQTVAAAHDRGIVHRDLKPDNVMVDDLGAVYVMDWGLAYSVHSAGDRSHVSAPSPGEIAGTPSYMAPEQARGRADEIGPRSDVFALGTILYEILTGKNPFREGTVKEALRAVQELEPPPAVRVNPRAGRALSAVCRKAMSKEGPKRYATARELADEIRRYREFRPVAAAPPTPLERLANLARRRPAVAASIATFLAVLLLIGVARGYRAFAEHQLVERALGNVEAVAAEILEIDATLVDARRAAASAPAGSNGDALRARADALAELRTVKKEQLRTFALAVVVFTLDRPDPRARAIYRLELREAIGEALRDGQPTRAAAMAEEAIAEVGRRNVPGWTAADVAWLEARRDEARALAPSP